MQVLLDQASHYEGLAQDSNNSILVILQENNQQGKSEGFDSCDWPRRSSNLAQICSKSLTFQPLWPWNLLDDHKKL